MLGSFAGIAAVAQGASGDVIISGGVSIHVADFIPKSNFISRF